MLAAFCDWLHTAERSKNQQASGSPGGARPALHARCIYWKSFSKVAFEERLLEFLKSAVVLWAPCIKSQDSPLFASLCVWFRNRRWSPSLPLRKVPLAKRARKSFFLFIYRSHWMDTPLVCKCQITLTLFISTWGNQLYRISVSSFWKYSRHHILKFYIKILKEIKMLDLWISL